MDDHIDEGQAKSSAHDKLEQLWSLVIQNAESQGTNAGESCEPKDNGGGYTYAVVTVYSDDM